MGVHRHPDALPRTQRAQCLLRQGQVGVHGGRVGQRHQRIAGPGELAQVDAAHAQHAVERRLDALLLDLRLHAPEIALGLVIVGLGLVQLLAGRRLQGSSRRLRSSCARAFFTCACSRASSPCSGASFSCTSNWPARADSPGLNRICATRPSTSAGTCTWRVASSEPMPLSDTGNRPARPAPPPPWRAPWPSRPCFRLRRTSSTAPSLSLPPARIRPRPMLLLSPS